MASYSYLQGNTVVDVIRDATGDRVETWDAYRTGIIDTRPPTADESAVLGTVANESTIRDRAAQALADNKTFLAISSPTNAQTVAQVKALTRQSNGLIRLALRRLDATD